MATPKIQNAYRNPSSDTEDIADLLLVTTSGLATDGDAGASYIVFHNGSNDVLVSSSNALPVSVSGVATAANQSTANGLLTTIDTDTGTIATHAATLAGAVSGTEMQVDIVSGTVTVTGVSTLTEQQSQTTLLGTIDTDTGAIATSVASLDSKTPALGQALAAASVPVVLTAAQLSTLTPPAAITGFATESTLGNLSAKFAGGTVIGDVNLGATDNAVLDAIAASVASTDGKITACNTGAVVVSSSALPSGAATAAKQPALGTAGTASADVITVQGIASMTALKVDGSAVTQPVSGTFWQATQPVSGTVAATQSGTWNVTNVSGTVSLPTGASTLAEQQSQTTHLATIAGDTTAIETAVQLIDDTVVAVDAVGTSAKVLMQGAIRDDALSALTPVEGDAVNLRTDANGALWTTISGTVTVGSHAVTNAGTFVVQENGAALTALQLIDDAVYTTNTAAVSKVIAIGAQDEGDTGFVRALQYDANNNGLMVSLVGASGSIFVKGIDSHDAGPVTSPIMVAGGYASAAAPTSVSTDGDAVYQWHLPNGSQVCNLAVGGTLVTGSAGLPVAQQGTWTVTANGGVNHDSADSGAPVKIGARAAATLSDDTMVANADRTDAVSDLDGALIVRPGFPLGDLISERVTDTGGSSTAFTNFGATASTRSYITAITVYNSSATAGTIDFRDGTGGSVLWTVPIPATGGAVIANGGVPLFCTTANTSLAYDVSAALTTVTISISGFKSRARA